MDLTRSGAGLLDGNDPLGVDAVRHLCVQGFSDVRGVEAFGDQAPAQVFDRGAVGVIQLALGPAGTQQDLGIESAGDRIVGLVVDPVQLPGDERADRPPYGFGRSSSSAA